MNTNPYGCNDPDNCPWPHSEATNNVIPMHGQPIKMYGRRVQAIVDEMTEWDQAQQQVYPMDPPTWHAYLKMLPITLAVTAWFFVCLALMGYWGYLVAIPTTNAFFWYRAIR